LITEEYFQRESLRRRSSSGVGGTREDSFLTKEIEEEVVKAETREINNKKNVKEEKCLRVVVVFT